MAPTTDPAAGIGKKIAAAAKAAQPTAPCIFSNKAGTPVHTDPLPMSEAQVTRHLEYLDEKQPNAAPHSVDLAS